MRKTRTMLIISIKYADLLNRVRLLRINYIVENTTENMILKVLTEGCIARIERIAVIEEGHSSCRQNPSRPISSMPKRRTPRQTQ